MALALREPLCDDLEAQCSSQGEPRHGVSGGSAREIVPHQSELAAADDGMGLGYLVCSNLRQLGKKPAAGWRVGVYQRRTVYSFAVLALLAILSLLFSAISANLMNVATSLVLLVASLFTLVLTLMKQILAEKIGRMATENQAFTKMTSEVEAQVRAMSDVGRQMRELQEVQGTSVDHLEQLANGFVYANRLEKLTQITRAFTDQEARSAYFAEGALDGHLNLEPEIHGFLDAIRATFKANITCDSLDDLRDEFIKAGHVYLYDVKLLNAVVCSDCKKERRTLIGLLRFLLKPSSEEERDAVAALAAQHLAGHPHLGTKSQMEEELERLQGLVEEDGRIPGSALEPLLTAVFRKFQPDDPE